jgi:hypothetical protein
MSDGEIFTSLPLIEPGITSRDPIPNSFQTRWAGAWLHSRGVVGMMIMVDHTFNAFKAFDHEMTKRVAAEVDDIQEGTRRPRSA